MRPLRRPIQPSTPPPQGQAQAAAPQAAAQGQAPTLEKVRQAGENARKQRNKVIIARTALGLRDLALAAQALRALPGGGAAADTLTNALDAMVNRGGRIYAAKGLDGKAQLKRTAPKVQGVGWAFLLSVAPMAMRAIGPAVAAARVGLARFGGAIVANAKTAASFVASKAAPLLAKLKDNPTFAKVAGFASKALTAASVALGISAVLPKTRGAVDDAATAAVQKTRQAGGAVARATGRAAQATADAAAAIPDAAAGLGTAAKWATAGLLALLGLKFLG